MATVTITVLEDSVREDKRERTFVQAQDNDTNQFVTFYPRKDMPKLFDKLQVGEVVALSGTIHNIGDNPKIIVTELVS